MAGQCDLELVGLCHAIEEAEAGKTETDRAGQVVAGPALKASPG